MVTVISMPENSSDEWGTSQRQTRTSRSEKQIGTKTMSDLLFLPDAERSLMKWLLQQQSASLTEVATFLAQDESSTQVVLDQLMEQGFVRSAELNEQLRYQPCLASRKTRQVPSKIWNALDS